MGEVSVTTRTAPIEVAVRSTAPVTLSLVSQAAQIALISSPGPEGAPGPSGPDPWLEPIQDIEASGALAINYALGKHVRLTLAGDVTSFAVSGWPVTNRIARLTLEILNSGDFGILAWPNGTIWQSGSVPEVTRGDGARDRIILSTTDAGATIYGDPVGFDYR
jgi:hypothetical protein